MKTFLHLICDYDQGDLAWAEITAAMAAQLPKKVQSHTTTVPSFDTIATGFALAQLALAQPPLRPKRLVIFANTAPRKDRHGARKNNAGEGLLWGMLDNGVELVAVNSGHTLSFVRDRLVKLRTTHAPDRGSQFRSRDFFPKIVAAAVKGKRNFTRKKLIVAEVVPEMPSAVVAYQDCFGNLKTSIRDGHALVSQLTPGSEVRITLEGSDCVRTAKVATGSFNVEEGDLAFAPGSSGHDCRFWELFKRGGSACEYFGHPATGAKISISSAMHAPI